MLSTYVYGLILFAGGFFMMLAAGGAGERNQPVMCGYHMLRGDHFGEGLDAAGRRADREDLVGRHEGRRHDRGRGPERTHAGAKARGGKLILLENLGDYAQSPYAGIGWHASVVQKMFTNRLSRVPSRTSSMGMSMASKASGLSWCDSSHR